MTVNFLKLGGSVITDKSRSGTSRPKTIRRIATEIAQALEENPSLRLLLGHGSGSFGHSIAAKYNTHLGAQTSEDWNGFVEVWQAARELNIQVVEALRSTGLPAVAFPPSASVLSESGNMISIAHEPIQRALDSGLIPVVYGDVVFDRSIGASIASTEAIFALLVEHLKPSRLLLAGLAEGVYETTGSKSSPIPEITPSIRVGLEFTSPEGQDVTGGMADKVDFCLSIAQSYPQIEILIFSAEEPGLLFRVLCDQSAGTRIRSQ